MAYDVPLATRVTATVDHRLRMLALIRRQSLSHVLSVLLDQALPTADDLVDLLREKPESRHDRPVEAESDAGRLTASPEHVDGAFSAANSQSTAASGAVRPPAVPVSSPGAPPSTGHGLGGTSSDDQHSHA